MDFGGFGVALEDHAIDGDGATEVIASGGDFGSGEDAAGDIDGHGAIHEEEGLLGNDAGGAFAVGHVGVTEVETLHEFGEIAAVDVSVDGAAVAVGFFGEVDGLAAEGAVEFSAKSEEGIAHGFEVEAADIGAPEEAILGIDFFVVRVGLATFLVDMGEHDDAVELFDGPIFFDERGGEVVEEFGVGRGFALGAEVIEGGDEAFAEVVHPEAIDEDASGEGIGFGGDGLGEFEATALIFGEGFG